MADFEIENSFNGLVVGIDEAGRGPWAGPVVAGAVIVLDKNLSPILLNGLDDSKKLSEKADELLLPNINVIESFSLAASASMWCYTFVKALSASLGINCLRR